MRIFGFLGFIATLISSQGAFAAFPTPWQMTFQEAVTPVMERIIELHNNIMIVLSLVVLVVLSLLIYVCVKFNRKANPVPAKFSHNVTIEVIWTAIPVLIVAMIAIPTFKALRYAETTPKSELTIKVVGYQWYWNYSYPEYDDISFDSYIIPDEDIKPGQHRLLEVDNRIVIPENTVVKFLVTAGDVIHSFAVPAFGIKTDAVPGRTNETWIKVTKPGVYYGQCSELCGVNHGFMPIAVEVVSKERFQEWIAGAKMRFAAHDPKSMLQLANNF